jgi:predicted transposase YbfD/YdcC
VGEIPENVTVRYYTSSATLTARQFADAIRNHWMIENRFHRHLDVAMGEDDCRIRRDKAAMNTNYLSELLMAKGSS